LFGRKLSRPKNKDTKVQWKCFNWFVNTIFVKRFTEKINVILSKISLCAFCSLNKKRGVGLLLASSKTCFTNFWQRNAGVTGRRKWRAAEVSYLKHRAITCDVVAFWLPWFVCSKCKVPPVFFTTPNFFPLCVTSFAAKRNLMSKSRVRKKTSATRNASKWKF